MYRIAMVAIANAPTLTSFEILKLKFHLNQETRRVNNFESKYLNTKTGSQNEINRKDSIP